MRTCSIAKITNVVSTTLFLKFLMKRVLIRASWASQQLDWGLVQLKTQPYQFRQSCKLLLQKWTVKRDHFMLRDQLSLTLFKYPRIMRLAQMIAKRVDLMGDASLVRYHPLGHFLHRMESVSRHVLKALLRIMVDAYSVLLNAQHVALSTNV